MQRKGSSLGGTANMDKNLDAVTNGNNTSTSTQQSHGSTKQADHESLQNIPETQDEVHTNHLSGYEQPLPNGDAPKCPALTAKEEEDQSVTDCDNENVYQDINCRTELCNRGEAQLVGNEEVKPLLHADEKNPKGRPTGTNIEMGEFQPTVHSSGTISTGNNAVRQTSQLPLTSNVKKKPKYRHVKKAGLGIGIIVIIGICIAILIIFTISRSEKGSSSPMEFRNLTDWNHHFSALAKNLSDISTKDRKNKEIASVRVEVLSKQLNHLEEQAIAIAEILTRQSRDRNFHRSLIRNLTAMVIHIDYWTRNLTMQSAKHTLDRDFHRSMINNLTARISNINYLTNQLSQQLLNETREDESRDLLVQKVMGKTKRLENHTDNLTRRINSQSTDKDTAMAYVKNLEDKITRLEQRAKQLEIRSKETNVILNKLLNGATCISCLYHYRVLPCLTTILLIMYFEKYV